MTPQALGVIIKRFSTDGRVVFDDFVACLIKLRSLTSTWMGYTMCSVCPWYTTVDNLMEHVSNGIVIGVCFQLSSKQGTFSEMALLPFVMMR